MSIWGRGSAAVVAVVLGLGLGALIASVGVAGWLASEASGAQAATWRSNGSEALSLKAEAELRAGRTESAARLSRSVLEVSPIDVRALRILGLSASADGDVAKAEALMGAAAARSLRDGDSHAWLLDRALLEERYDDAFLHADALMRRSNTNIRTLAWRMVATLGSADAQRALAKRLATNPPWRWRLLLVMTQEASWSTAGSTFEELAKVGGATNDELTPFFLTLVGHGSFGHAQKYWSSLTGRASKGSAPYIYNGNFDAPAAPMPLDWQGMPVVGGAAIWMADGRPAGQLRLRHDGFSSSDPLIRQVLFLPPGNFKLTTVAQIPHAMATKQFSVNLICVSGTRLVQKALAPGVGAWGSDEARFEVPADGCAAQWLSFNPIIGDLRSESEIRIDRVEVSRDVAAATGKDPE